MKSNKITLLTLSLFLSFSISAQIKPFIPLFIPKAPIKKQKITYLSKSDFGMYKIQPYKRLIPQSLVNEKDIIAPYGDMAIIKTDQSINRIGKNTLVRHIFTGKILPLSGDIVVLLKNGVSINALQKACEVKLQIVNDYKGTRIIIVRNTEIDILLTRQALKKTGLVEEVRIQVIGNHYHTT
jgi:hypothetical protein